MRPLRLPLARSLLVLAPGRPKPPRHIPSPATDRVAGSLPSLKSRPHRLGNRRLRIDRAMMSRMTMSPTRRRDCIVLPGWSQRELARHLGIDGRAASKMSSGKRDIPPELEAWLEAVAAAWGRLDPDLLEVARNIGCDQGQFSRRPRGFRPLTDGEAAQLKAVAAFRLAHPRPDGWVAEREVPDAIRNERSNDEKAT